MYLAFKRDFLHKYLMFLFLVFFFVLCLSSNVFASTKYYSEDLDYEFTFPDKWDDKNVYIFAGDFNYNNGNDISYNVQIIVCSSPVSFERGVKTYPSGNKYYGYYIKSDNNDDILFYSMNNPQGNNISAICNTISFAKDRDFTSDPVFISFEDIGVDVPTQEKNFVAISLPHNILTTDGDVVFQAPLQVQPIVASQVGEVNMNKTLLEILGILPTVLVVIVGLLAIRKGIQFLMVRMKKA